MTPYHIIGFLVSLNIVFIILLLKKRKPLPVIPQEPPPMKDGRTIRYAWIRINDDYPRMMCYTDTHKPGVQKVQIHTSHLNRHYANEQIKSMNTAWIEHGIAFDQ